MIDASDRYQALADGFAARIGAVPQDRWANRSPCPEWSAADIGDHLADPAIRFLAFAGRAVSPGRCSG